MNYQKRCRATRRRRRNEDFYLRVANSIRRAQPVLGGLFYADDYRYCDYQNGHFDYFEVDFLGQRNRIVYCATLQTTRSLLKEKLFSLARTASEELVPLDWSWLHRPDVDGKFSPPPDGQHSEFGGLTRSEFISSEQRRIADANTVSVFERCTLNHGYSVGVALDATIDVPFLTVEEVNRFIRRFLEGGERPYCGEVALSYPYDEVPNW